MSEHGHDLPADVRDTLVQLFTASQDALQADDPASAASTVDSAATVATNKVPEGPLREQLLFGCETVSDLLEADDGDHAAAAEYLAAMQRRVED